MEERERLVWWHWQNLNEGRDGRPKGLPWHGRAWLHLGRGRGALRQRIEWTLGPFAFMTGAHLRLDPTGEEPVMVGVGCRWLAGLHYGGDFGRTFKKLLTRIVGKSDVWKGSLSAREIGVKVFDNAVWWDLWVDPNGWVSSRPWYRDGSFRPLDAIFGKEKFTSKVVETWDDFYVPMPEKVYRGTGTLTEDTWKRPRWFTGRTVLRANIDMHEPIPVPGKGENSWDCGEDAIHGTTCVAGSLSEAIAKMVESALRTRAKYGGKNWRPEEEQAQRELPLAQGKPITMRDLQVRR